MHEDPPPPHGHWHLKPVHLEDLAAKFALGTGGLALGRAPSNDVVLSADRFPQVSAHHARLHASDGTVVLTDLGSRNGTYVNGHRVARHVLHDGDFVQLGRGGPQFVIECDRGSATEVILDEPRVASRRADPSQSTIMRLKRALGVPAHADVAELVRGAERRSRAWIVAGSAAVAIAAGVAMIALLSRNQVEQTHVEAALQRRIDATATAYETQRLAWEQEKARLEQERTTLQERLRQIVDHEQTATTEVATLRVSLQDTNAKLDRFNPVNVEQARLAGVGRVQRAVVYIETTLRYRSSKTHKLLRHKPESASDPEATMTFDDGHPVMERESSGSGFCIAGDGHIISNAHVVRPSGHDLTIPLDSDETLEPELVHAAVFNGSDVRHPASVVAVRDGGDDDLALLEIEPFEGMPHLEAFDTNATVPPPGTEVYLHGFPLGKMAIQEGDKVIASTFRGILSRSVSSWLQVDAAVHPGNSGGPLTDATGRVIGIVCRVQRIPDGPLAPDMGYAIPIGAAASIWPLPVAGK